MDKGKDHIRAFAGEVLTAICAIGLSVANVLEPLHIPNMEDHIQCFKYLWMIADYLTTQKCLEQMGPFKEAVRNHHRMYVELYGDMVKPKLHDLRQVVDSITHVGKVLSCFVTERRHKVAKQQALRVFKNLSKACVSK